MKEERSCLECGTKLHGRVDKKFCSDHCRNAHHNRQNSDVNNYVRNVNNILRRNRRILESLNPKGKAKVSREKLVEKGLNFNYFTSIYTTKDQRTYYFCYEQGFLQLEDGSFALVVKKEYLN